MGNQVQRIKEDKDTVDFATYAEAGAKLYSDFFSDATRKRQSQLLITAILVILVSHSLVNITGISLGGADITFRNQVILIWSVRVLCLYFSLVYTLGILQDYQAFAFEERLIRYKIDDFINRITDKNLPVEDLLDKYIKDEWLREEWRKTITSSVIEIASAMPLGLAGSLSFVKSIFSVIGKEKPDPKQYERGKITSGIIVERYKQFSSIRNTLEIGFPILLGLFALWFSFI